MTSLISQRLTDMQNSKSGYDNRWKKANNRKWSFLRDDGNYHPPTMFTITNDTSKEIVSAFDGKIEVKPKPDGKKTNLYKKLTAIYNESIDNINTDSEREKAIQNAVDYRMGVLFEGYLNTNEAGGFSGLISESVDPRDFFIDDSAQVWYDPQGNRGAKDCIRRRWYKADALKETFKDPIYNQKIVNSMYDLYNNEDNEEGSDGDHLNREQQTQENNLISIDESADGLVQVLEYWTNEKFKLVFFDKIDEPFYDGENPYGMLPFSIYNVVNTDETLYPPSINELIAPMIDRKDVMSNLMYLSAKLNQMPLIFAHEKTGLIAGQEITAGIQTVELEDNDNINNFIQQIQVGGITESSQIFINMIEDEIISASKIDTKSIIDTPQETATKTKKKIATELKSIRNIVSTMMKTAETYRAILRARNILKFVLANTKEVLVNNTVITKDDTLKQATGSIAMITIDPLDWENFEFDVIIKSQTESDLEKEEKVNQALRALEIVNVFMGNPNVPPELKQRVDFAGLLEQIIENISIIDTSRIFKQGAEKSKVGLDIESMKQGVGAEPDVKDNAERMDVFQKIVSEASKVNDPKSKDEFLQYLYKINDPIKPKKPPIGKE